jgi:signal transduction histidine kinase/CheY-like chemotaxis protein
VVEHHLKRLSREDVPEIYSFRIIDRNGNTKWLEISAVITTWENRPATLNFLTDITERKKAEESLREREKQFYQAQKMEAIGRLTAGIVHDFNNLLTAVIGFSDLLLMRIGNKDDISYKYLREIKEAGNRAASLINKLLAFSRRQIMQPQIINVNALVSDMENILKRVIGEDVSLAVNLEPNLGNVKADRTQIEQVIMNLAVNARDAMPDGGKLTIETKNVYLNNGCVIDHVSVKPGYYVMLAITDNGIGMDKETQEHVFEPFFTTKAEGKGTGLGLSAVYGIVKQSGGYIWVDSEKGNGTTFRIYLPGVLEKAEIRQFHELTAKKLTGNEIILLVEDDDFGREVTSTILKSLGYNIIEAKSGDEAISICMEQKIRPVDLLITDVIMPGINGRELFEKLSTKCPDLKVLYMSGYANNVIVHHGLLENGIHFIQKPFAMNDFARKVREVLEG